MTRKILIDGQEIPAERIEVVYEGVFIPGEDQLGSLHVNLSEEGIIMDVWGADAPGEDVNHGTSSQTAEEITEQLCAEND